MSTAVSFDPFQPDLTIAQCFVPPTSNASTISKFCLQICSILKRKPITVNENRDACNWMIQALKLNSDESAVVNILNALYEVLKSGYLFPEVYTELFGKYGVLWNFLNSTTQSKIVHLSLKCIYAITSSFENNPPQNVVIDEDLHICSKKMIAYLFKKQEDIDNDFFYYEIIINALKILQNIYLYNETINTDPSESIGACRYWMVYGLDVDDKTCLCKAIPSQQTLANIDCENIKKGGKRIKLRKPRNSRNPTLDETKSNDVFNSKSASCSNFELIHNSPSVTSESDLSDSENSMQAKINALKTKIRLASLNLLHIVIQSSDKHVAFSFWWTLLPDVKTSSIYKCGGLGICAALEPTSSGRRAAFTVLLSLLTTSRSYLMQADTSKHLTVSFTPFSVALGISIENIHFLLQSQLSKETSIPVLTVILKCIAAVVQATPYHKLGGNVILPLVNAIKRLVLHKEWTLQVQSLIAMGCIISVTPPLDEICDCLMNNVNILDSFQNISVSKNENDVPKNEENCKKQIFNTKEMSWLIEICLSNLGWVLEDGSLKKSHQSVTPIRSESLQVLSIMSLQYFDELIAPTIEIIQQVLSNLLEDNSTEICLHAAKCISSTGDAISKSVQNDSSHIFKFVAFWTNLFNGGLTKLIQSDQHTPARAVACDCLGSMGETIFIHLDESLRILTATLLLGCTGDEDPSVRAAAVRALAVSIMYQQWREDICLITDCCEMTLRVIVEESPAVKLKASWALANITDALLLNKNNPQLEMIDPKLFFRLLNAAIQVSNENDKIKVNAVRAIGNLLFLIEDLHFNENEKCQNICIMAVEKLRQNVTQGNMKVRWNACHALGKSLKNETLYVYLNKWQEDVLESLCSLIQSCRNLKVCSHACTALSSPVNRTHYASKFISIWEIILKVLNSSQHVEDFNEYNHRNSLIQQLCITLCHMACLLTDEDLMQIYNALCFYWEVAAHSIQQVMQRAEPQSETLQKLLEATKHVTTVLHSSNEKQQQSIAMLQNMFIWDYTE